MASKLLFNRKWLLGVTLLVFLVFNIGALPSTENTKLSNNFTSLNQYSPQKSMSPYVLSSVQHAADAIEKPLLSQDHVYYSALKHGDILDGQTATMFVSGDYLFVADELGGLKIIDYSNYSNPILVKEIDEDEMYTTVFVDKGIAFVGVNSELRALNVSDPSNPVFLWERELPGLQQIHISGEYLYYLTGRELGILDISDVSRPLLISVFPASKYYFESFVMGNNTVFIAAGIDGMVIVDTTSIDNPALLSTYKGSDIIVSLYKRGDYVFAATLNSNIEIINVTIPTNPVKIGFYDLTSHKLSGTGNLLFALSYAEGITALNITNVTQVTKIWSNDSSVFSLNTLAVSTHKVFVSDFHTIYLFNITDSFQINYLAEHKFTDNFWLMEKKGSLIWTASEFDLYLLNATDPDQPGLMAKYETPGGITSLIVREDTLLIGDSLDGLLIYDTSSLPSLPLLSQYPIITKWIWDMEENNSLVYAGLDGSLQIINITDVSNPVKVSELNLGMTPYYVKLVGNYLFFTSGEDGFGVIDVSDPYNPSLISIIDDDEREFNNFEIKDDVAFVCMGNYGIKVLNVSNPSSISLITNFGPAWLYVSDISINGSLLIAAKNYGGGVQFVNISDPANPILAGDYPVTGDNHAMVREGNMLYLATQNNGIFIIEISENVPPKVEAIDLIPKKPIDGDNVSIVIEATDQSGIAWVNITYKLNEDVWTSMRMTKLDNESNKYHYCFGVLKEGDTIKYYFTLKDNSILGNIMTDNNNFQYYSFSVMSKDFTPPKVLDVNFDPNPEENQEIIINATIYDENGIFEARIVYTVDEGETWAYANMVEYKENKFTANIGSFAAKEVIKFYVIAKDNSFNHNLATLFKSENPIEYFTIVVKEPQNNQTLTTPPAFLSFNITTIIPGLSIAVTIYVLKKKR